MPEHIHFVTGKLAEQALRRVVEPLAHEFSFGYTIDVLPITVAALMTPEWIARRVAVPAEATRVILPGYCSGDLAPLTAVTPLAIELGPRDLRQLPEYFGGQQQDRANFGVFNIEIVAEINHAPRLTTAEILAAAQRWRREGADVIDLGCEPGGGWSGVGDCVRALRTAGHRVSIDSLHPAEINAAVAAGAELVLSVHATNRELVAVAEAEFVVIPDEPGTLVGLEETIRVLERRGARYRLDPILEPIGCGFAASLGRYIETRRRYPQAAMLMGVGNLTELSDVDSAGVNLLLLGVCQELDIRSVLTTEVINWARSSVRECDAARRLVHFAVNHGVPPKNLSRDLVMLRDPRPHAFGDQELDRLAGQLRDHGYRLFAEQDRLHLVAASLHLADDDPFRLFEQLLQTQPAHLDASHAFYLGYELAKARIALTLGKQYEQDEALQWGLLTQPENHHRLK